MHSWIFFWTTPLLSNARSVKALTWKDSWKLSSGLLCVCLNKNSQLEVQEDIWIKCVENVYSANVHILCGSSLLK